MNKNLKKIVIIMWIIMLLEAMIMLVLTIRDYNNSHNSNDTEKYSLQEEQRAIYNSAISQYIGSNKKGVDVKSLIDAVIASNNNCAGESGSFIAITPVGFSTLENSADTNLQNEKRIGEPGLANNSENIVNGHSLTMSKLKSYVNMGKRYDIVANYKDEVIIEIIITGHQNSTETNTITNE